MNVVHARNAGMPIRENIFTECADLNIRLVKDKHPRHAKNVRCRPHYQITQRHGKRLRVAIGEVFDVSVDSRKSSPTIRRWLAIKPFTNNKRILWISPGFAHEFLVISDQAEIVCKTKNYWDFLCEQFPARDDPQSHISGPPRSAIRLSTRDQKGALLLAAEVIP